MFTLYESDETEFINGGLLEIDDIITYSKVEQGINKAFICNMTIVKDELEKYKEITGERIIYLPTPMGRQPFDIIDIMPNGDYELNIFLRHVFHRLGRRTVKRCKVDNGNGAFILNKYKANLDRPVPHVFNSNIAAQASLDWVRKKGLVCLMGDDDNSFLNKLGGELYVNGFNVAINTRIGTDRGFTAMYRKNITGFTGNESYDSLVTRVMPIGFDEITIPDDYVDSPNINKYSDVYTDTVKFETIKWKGSPNNSSGEGFDTLEEAQTELIKATLNYFIETKCDLVKATFDVDIALLQDTEEYKDTAILEQLFLGDDITIDFEPFNIMLNKRMVYYTYDSILQRYETIQLGEGEDNYFNDINDKFNNLPSKEEVTSGLQDAIDQAFKNVNDLISNGGNNSYIKFLPNVLNPSEIVACDNEDLAKAVYVVRFNKNGIGVSSTGFNGKYQGLVTEGKLAINEITCNSFTAALVKTGMLSDATGKTWINMDNGAFNFADKIKFDGENFEIDSDATKTSFNSINSSINIDDTGFLIKNGMFTIMDAFNKKVFGVDVDGGVSFTGRLQPNDNIIRLFGENCKLEGGYGGLRRVINNTYDSVTSDGSWVLFNSNSNEGTRYTGITTDLEGHTQLYNQTSMIKLLNLGTPGVQSRWLGDDGYAPMAASAFTVASRAEFKENIHTPEEVDFKAILKNSEIKAYHYKNEVNLISKIPTVLFEDGTNPIKVDKKLGLVIEELTEEARLLLHPINSDGIDLYSMASILWKICQEQEERLRILEEMIIKREV